MVTDEPSKVLKTYWRHQDNTENSLQPNQRGVKTRIPDHQQI